MSKLLAPLVGALLSTAAFRAKLSEPIQTPKFSIVSAVYNVEKYLDDYFRSIVRQPEFLRQVQIIAVDDGSTDRSPHILKSWQRRFPGNITILTKENGGQASARNLGLEHATGEWVTFIDPDDFVADDYFARTTTFIAEHDCPAEWLQFVSSNMLFYREDRRAVSDTHALRFRFAESVAVPIERMGPFVQLSVNSVLFRRQTLTRAGILFDPRIRPSFEDGHFVAQFILACTGGRVGFNSEARYFYRKRSDQTSSIDTSKADPRRYSDLFRFGYVDILRRARAQVGMIPIWLQRTVLYDLTWHLRDIVDHEERLPLSEPAEFDSYLALLAEAFSFIDSDTIREFELAGIWDLFRIGMLRTFKGEALAPSRAVLDAVDETTGSATIRWFSAYPDDEAVAFVDGKAAKVLDRGSQAHTLVDRVFAYENRLRVAAAGNWLSLRLSDVPTDIQIKRLRTAPRINIADHRVRAALVDCADSSRDPLRIRGFAKSEQTRMRFQGCWLLMDRDVHADDNAEHLYRYIRAARPDINAFFVLQRSSGDWGRLQADGFELLEFGSREHDAAMLHASFLISSHADHYLFGRWPARDYGDALKRKFIFLQHGVIKHDLSLWLNKKDIALMLSSSYAERQSLIGPGTRCKFLPSELALTGLPRHDALIKATQSERQILIAPTWRRWLVTEPSGLTSRRDINDAFKTTEYAHAWKSLLHSTRFAGMLRQHGYSAAFFPHAYIQPYLEWFDVPPHIRTARHDGSTSIQSLLARSRLLISDYSSLDFELAYLARGTVYYQFDRERMFGGAHTTRKGYFDYERDGFGPVCLDETATLDAIEDALSNDGQMQDDYLMRSLTTFAWRDGKCCERVVAAIEQIGRKTVPDRQHNGASSPFDDWEQRVLQSERAAEMSQTESGY